MSLAMLSSEVALAALQQTAVQIEDVSRVGLAARWAAEQGHLTVGHSLLGQIVVHSEGQVAGVAEELADGGPVNGA